MYLPTNNKIHPEYFYQVIKRRDANPIFITVDWDCLNFIKSHRGICLYCKKYYEPSLYDLSIFYQREAWVLYSTLGDRPASLLLGRTIQLTGATRVLITHISPGLLLEDNHVI